MKNSKNLYLLSAIAFFLAFLLRAFSSSGLDTLAILWLALGSVWLSLASTKK